MPSHLAERWTAMLDRLREEGRQRRLVPPCGVDFSSNDYLGFGKEAPPCEPDAPARDSSSPSLARRAQDEYPPPCEPDAPARDSPPSLTRRAQDLSRGGQASRLLRGQHPIWEEVESALARWHGVEAATIFSCGYLANEGLLSTLVEPQDLLVSDEGNHASLIDGARLSKAEKAIFLHNDLSDLERLLRAAADKGDAKREIFIVTESLFGMDGARAPLRELCGLAERFHAHVIVDEAHATGCFGDSGAGLVDAAGLRARVLATIHTGGKALGVPGAYVAGSAQLKELLVNRCRHFIFTTALPPVIGGWWLHALTQVQQARERRDRLHGLAAYARDELARRGIMPSGSDYIVPIVLGHDRRALEAAQRLQNAGWDIRAIRPPTVPPGTARLRISIHADHERDTLRRLAAALDEVLGS